ncbi:DUF3325 domain-containing protein [Comamonas sp. CMM03]|uniref:DUF3325 family protein n=1 Tax=Comamonas sp. CMM03 TaxID=2854781 RepID=UPI001C45D429|nr:DUF3325 family protein [Comamonas sp. CMM03]MBV7418773.1 DUF3325 domain-containing protein [Comamonas sp. CMM03]
MSRHLDRHPGMGLVLRMAVALRALLRCVGVLLLAGVWVPCVAGWNATVGTVAAIGFWSLGALLAAGGMSCSPR